jgi:hypothetical protein
MERCWSCFLRPKRGGRPILNSLTSTVSTSHFDGRNNPMKTPKKLINVEIQYHLDTFDIERLVEATRILMEALAEEVDVEWH